MAARARAGLDRGVGPVGQVARDAGFVAVVIDLHFRVAGSARGGRRGGRVGRVAAGAPGVGRGSDVTREARSVGLVPWQPTQTREACATNSCGLWQLRQESWPAGLGPAGLAWQVEQVWVAALAGVCGLWQSTQPWLPLCWACERAFSS